MEELKKEAIVEEVGSGCNDVYYKFLEDLQNLYKRPPSNEDRIDPVGFLKSFISSLLAKQQEEFVEMVSKQPYMVKENGAEMINKNHLIADIKSKLNI
jgi:hypothetical protein